MRFALLALLVLTPAAAHAQGRTAPDVPEAALPFLDIPPSPSLNAIGGAGVALPTADPYGFLYNPAQPGLAARDVRAAAAVYPGGTIDWLNQDALTLGSAAAMGGATVRAGRLPLAVGVSVAQTALRADEVVVSSRDGSFMARYRPTDRYRALGAAVGTMGPLRVALGASVRHVTSSDRPVITETTFEARNVRGFTFDLGLLAEADVARLARGRRADRFDVGGLRPALALSAGYAQANIGGTVAYSAGGAQPLPRMARLGTALAAGLDIPANERSPALRLAGVDLAVQAEHPLARRRDGRLCYEPLLGDLSLFRNGVLGEGDAVTTGRRGVRLAVGETVEWASGSLDGYGFHSLRTRGFGLRLAGPLKMAARLSGNDDLARLAARVDLRYDHAVYFSGNHTESRFDGLTLVVR